MTWFIPKSCWITWKCSFQNFEFLLKSQFFTVQDPPDGWAQRLTPPVWEKNSIVFNRELSLKSSKNTCLGRHFTSVNWTMTNDHYAVFLKEYLRKTHFDSFSSVSAAPEACELSFFAECDALVICNTQTTRRAQKARNFHRARSAPVAAGFHATPRNNLESTI